MKVNVRKALQITIYVIGSLYAFISIISTFNGLKDTSENLNTVLNFFDPKITIIALSCILFLFAYLFYHLYKENNALRLTEDELKKELIIVTEKSKTDLQTVEERAKIDMASIKIKMEEADAFAKKTQLELINTNIKLNITLQQERDLWQQLIKINRVFYLSKPFDWPDVQNLLNRLLEELEKRFPLKMREKEVRISIVVPGFNGTIKILAVKRISEDRRQYLEKYTKWKINGTSSYYEKAINLDIENNRNKKYYRPKDGEPGYFSGRPTQSYESSKAHFFVSIKKDVYKEEFPGSCVAVVSISSPDKTVIPLGEEEEEVFYLSIYSVIKGIEAVLIQYAKSARKSNINSSY
ncbi:hypothetical protein [Larkinella terrae]|uniref:Uncharacterized protein n=1 Tax=Larkinella terrae TaxID=2025311 RepID=A0A7K0ET81_9BACT|nr:hypothetical protein [Larkinella terrae]MRS64756.1 hypothetical protein [Larkinella terrae]